VALADIQTLSLQDKMMILPFWFNAQKISGEVFFGMTLCNSKVHHTRDHDGAEWEFKMGL
jgi:hypothetical protein